MTKCIYCNNELKINGIYRQYIGNLCYNHNNYIIQYLINQPNDTCALRIIYNDEYLIYNNLNLKYSVFNRFGGDPIRIEDDYLMAHSFEEIKNKMLMLIKCYIFS
jgi:hypothetical protein